MPEKSFIEYAYDVLSTSKEPLSFKDLFDKTLELSGLKLSTNDLKVKMSKLYTSLSVDSRFVMVDKLWDLSSRHTFSQIHQNDNDFDDEDDDDETDEEEKDLLRQELGEESDDDSDRESDDIDFDKPQVDPDEDEEF